MLEARHVLLLAAAVAAGARGQYVTEEDQEMARVAHESIDQYCHGQKFTGSVDRSSGYSEIQKQLGGQNVALEVLSQASSVEEAQDIFMGKFGWSWMLQRGSALIIGLAMLLLGGILYFCKKCRCCNYERPTLEIQKTCVIVIIVITLVGIAWCSVTAVTGFNLQQRGMQNARCTMARFLDHALIGDRTERDSFIGLFPLLRKLESLEETLDNGTAFDDASKKNILEETDKLNRAADLASENLALLTDELMANQKPKFANGEPSYHDCILCEAVLPYVRNASETMKNSVATLLGKTRAEVDESIKNGGNAQLKQNLKKTTDAVVAWKDLAIDGSRKMYKDGLLAKLTKHENILKWVLFVGVLLVSLSAIGLIVTAALSVCRFKFNEMQETGDDEEGQVNPYNKMIHQHARRTWCWAFVYVMFALIVAGLLNILTAPFSSFCLVLHDLDGDKLEQIAPGLNLSFQDEQGTNWKAIMDKCVQEADGDDVNSFLLDMLVTNKGVSLKEQLKENARDVVQSRFSSVVKSSSGAAPPLYTDPVMQKLREAIKDNPVAEMIVGSRYGLENSDAYGDMRHDDNAGRLRSPKGTIAISQLGLGPVMNNSLHCANYTTSANLGNFSDILIVGIEEFADRLAVLGDPSSLGTSCAKQVVCKTKEYWTDKVTVPYNLEQACLAGNKYMGLKGRMLTEDVYRCNLFTKPGSTEACDPKDMKNQSGTYTGDCMDAQGAVAVFERRCNLNQFEDYIKSWDDRLATALQRADAEVARIRISANVSLEQLIGVHISTPIDALSSGVTCSFLSDYFQEGIDGFCYQGVVGTRYIVSSYIWCAIWTALLIPTMMWVYCRSKGNWENWSPDRAKYMDLKKKQEEAMDALLGKKKKEETQWITDPNGARISAPSTPGPPFTQRPQTGEESDSDSD